MNSTLVVILGIIEGLTEFLPISSTGHLILAQKILHIEQTSIIKSFDVIIQCGAISAVMVVYAKKIFLNTKIWKPLIGACIPTMAIGGLLHGLVKKHLLGNEVIVLLAMIIGGIALILMENNMKQEVNIIERIENISLPQSIAIGVGQMLALIPGTSRSAATIIAGLLLGISRPIIVEFSFFLAVPTMLGASILELKDSYHLFSLEDLWIIFLGFSVAFLTALIAMQWLVTYVQHHSFKVFGFYRILMALILWHVFY